MTTALTSKGCYGSARHL